MTTAVALEPPVVRTPQSPAAMPDWWAASDDCGQSGTLAIPLAEFGKSLADTDLDAWLERFAARNSDSGQAYAISHTGELLIMPPTGHPGVLYEGTFFRALGNWTDDNGGVAFPANARFRLPDGSRFGPDAAWFSPERQHLLMLPDSRPFPYLVPDFIAEVQSPSNSRRELVDKINLFLRYGTRLAWLLDGAAREVVIFRPGRAPETLRDPEFVDGDAEVLPGFRFAVREKIFDYFTIATE